MRHPLTVASAALVVTGSVLLLVGYNVGTSPDQADPPAARPAAETRPPASPDSALPGRAPMAVGPATSTAHAAPPGLSRPPSTPTALSQRRPPPVTAQPPPAAPRSATTTHPATTHPATSQPAASPSRLGIPGPDRVAVAAITVLRTVDTSRDRSPRDAAARALPLLGGQLAADVAAAGPRRVAGRTGPGGPPTARTPSWPLPRARTAAPRPTPLRWCTGSTRSPSPRSAATAGRAPPSPMSCSPP